jgi:hypothetical protein
MKEKVNYKEKVTQLSWSLNAIINIMKTINPFILTSK